MWSQVYKYLWKLVSTDTSTDQFVAFTKVRGNINLSKCSNDRQAFLRGEESQYHRTRHSSILIVALGDIHVYLPV